MYILYLIEVDLSTDSSIIVVHVLDKSNIHVFYS